MKKLNLKVDQEREREEKLAYIDKKQKRFNASFMDLEAQRKSRALNTIQAKTSRGKIPA